MQYMVIEKFRRGNAHPIFERRKEQGRVLPEGLSHIDSWISADLKSCFQLMETEDPTTLRAWTETWDDLINFEIVPVRASKDASAKA